MCLHVCVCVYVCGPAKEAEHSGDAVAITSIVSTIFKYFVALENAHPSRSIWRRIVVSQDINVQT